MKLTLYLFAIYSLHLYGEIEIYASESADALRPLITNVIDSAKKKVEIRIYTLKDTKVIASLDRCLKRGKQLNLYTPKDHSPLKLNNFLSFHHDNPQECKGLMHQKILIIDEETVLFGSANFTEDSLVRHQNLILKIQSPDLAHTLRERKHHRTFTTEGQLFEYWETPKSRKEALERLLLLINGANKSLKVAMYTWTHPKLAQAVIEAHKRGVGVEVFLDPGSAKGTSGKVADLLRKENVPLYLPIQCEMVHHKIMEVDGKTLVCGSLNWTASAFSKNQDAFIVLYSLTKKQKTKLNKIWNCLRHLSVPEKNSPFLDCVPWNYPIN
jgi:cardiolipin synthase A/B